MTCMENNEFKKIFQNLNFSDQSFDTFINAYKCYYSTINISNDKIDTFNISFNNFMKIYLSSKTAKEILDDLRKIREKHINTLVYFDFLLKFNKFENFSEEYVDIIISEHLVPVYYMLYNKKFSKKYEKIIKKKIFEDERGIEYWTNQYDFPKDNKYRYYLPKITDDEIDALIVKYINSEFRNSAN